MTNISINDFFNSIPEGSTVTINKGTPNPDTRRGVYVTYKSGLSSKTFFIGTDLTILDNNLLIERVG